MRLLVLVGLVGVLSGCGMGMEDQAPSEGTVSSERAQMGPPESWCRSYTTQQYCPKYICAWYSYPAPGYCSLPAESESGLPEESMEAQPAPETTQMDIDTWCRSYTTQRYCPKNVCVWNTYPSPGYCSAPATSVTDGQTEAANDCPGPAECSSNSACDAKCGGPDFGVCNNGSCTCAG